MKTFGYVMTHVNVIYRVGSKAALVIIGDVFGSTAVIE